MANNTAQLRAVASAIATYINYWKRPPAPPKTILWLQRLAEKLSIQWVPIGLSHYASNSYLDSERFHFENIFSSLTPQQLEEISKNKELAEAQMLEFRSRVYRLIHKGTASDHLMPVESRAYWLPSQRLPKLLLCVVLTVVAYCGLLYAPSFLYGTFFPDQALSRTYTGPHSLEVRDPEFINSVRKEFIEKIRPSELVSLLPTSAMNISNFVAIQRFSKKKAEDEIAAIRGLSNKAAWLLSSDTQKIEAASFTIFSELLKKALSSDDFLFTRRIVVTPLNNILELGTQIVMVVLIWVLLTLYLTRKHDFLNIYKDCEKNVSSLGTVICVDLLGTVFRGRQHFHSLVAAFAATVALCVHFYYIGQSNAQLAKPIAELVNLTPYDYRLAIDLQPVFLVHWIFQFSLIFLFVLLAWEVGILGRCLRQYQLHLLSKEILPKGDWSESSHLASRQKTAQVVVISSALLFLIVLGFAKSYSASGTLSFWINHITSPSRAELSQLVYHFSPAVLVVPLLFFATRAAYESAEEAGRALTKRGKKVNSLKEDEDFLASAIGRIPQIKRLLKKGAGMVS